MFQSFCLVNALHLPWKLNTHTLWAAFLSHVVRKRCSDVTPTGSVSEVGVIKSGWSNARCYVFVEFSAIRSQPGFDLLYYQSSKRSHLNCAQSEDKMMWPATPLFKRLDPSHRGHFPLEANSEKPPCLLTSVQWQSLSCFSQASSPYLTSRLQRIF